MLNLLRDLLIRRRISVNWIPFDRISSYYKYIKMSIGAIALSKLIIFIK